MLDPWILSVLLAYFAVVIGIALYRSRQMQDMADYVLGGRRVSSITSALSAGSSTTSAQNSDGPNSSKTVWTMLVLPALAFQRGLDTIWIAIMIVAIFITTDDPFNRDGAPAPGFWNPFTDSDSNPLTVKFLLSVMGWGIGVFGAQRILQRFMAIESEDQMYRSRNIRVFWLAATYGASIVFGLLALPVLIHLGVLDQIVADPERLYLVVAETLFHPLIVGVLLVAVIAAVMSTADSQLLLASAIATDDLPIIRKFTYSISTHSRVWLGRLLLLVIGIGAAAFSIYHPDSVLDLVAYAWGGMGAAFGPVTILTLFWRRFNFWGALTAMISGTAIASIWGTLSGGPGGIFDIHLATPGFFLAFPFAIAATYLTAKPTRLVTRMFDQVNVADRRRSRYFVMPRRPFRAQIG